VHGFFLLLFVFVLAPDKPFGTKQIEKMRHRLDLWWRGCRLAIPHPTMWTPSKMRLCVEKNRICQRLSSTGGNRLAILRLDRNAELGR